MRGIDHSTFLQFLSRFRPRPQYYQDHRLIIEIAKAAAEKLGSSFLYYDFRPYFREGQAQARAL
ncbi:MAG: hypothetical protein WC946_09385, partial [Bacteroidales bacterium]